jgi:hypothetical protein
MLGKPVAVFFLHFRAASRCIATRLFAAAQHLRIKKWRGEISSLDVQRERAMLPAKKMFRNLRDLFPAIPAQAGCLGRNT